jgi:hypothetical protein
MVLGALRAPTLAVERPPSPGAFLFVTYAST